MLVIDKPEGMISKDVSRWLSRKIPKKTKLGHVGTLDPLAGGVLPLLLGQATKLQDYLHGFDKSYEFDLKLGVETDSWDTDGAVLRTGEFSHVTDEALRRIVQGLTGEIEQELPVYSAVKYKGRPLYDYARSGTADQIPKEKLRKSVYISHLELCKFEGDIATFRVTCSKGTYVRSLAMKICEEAGCVGTISRIMRLGTAGISLGDAHSIDKIENGDGDIYQYLIPIERINLGIPQWKIPHTPWVKRLQQGQSLELKTIDFEQYLYATHGPLDLQTKGGALLLLDDTGVAFGLGGWEIFGFDMIKVSLKRGLQ
jgi:tRNA pseudouridine55 synthase